jgi:hypothetical protein
MSSGVVFTRMIVYGLVLSAIDAIGGRLFHAAPDPSFVIPLGAAAWASYRLAEGHRTRIAVPAGLVLWVAFMAGFVAWARVLVGWNGSVPWQPRSATWLLGFAACAVLASLAGRFVGSRAARSAVTGPADGSAPADRSA